MEKMEFRQMLTNIVELAGENDNQLTLEQVDSYFKNADLNNEQLDLVYSYLEANKITVLGHVVKEESVFEGEEIELEDSYKQLEAEEKQYVDMYLDELKDLDNVSDEEAEEIYRKAISGDPLAKSKLVEFNLLKVVDIAKSYANRGVLLGDLIQEGNVGLMLAVDALGECNNEEAKKLIELEIISSLENAIEEIKIVKNSKNNMLSRVNFLNEGALNLEEELGRRCSIEELSKYMEMTEAEIIDIIRISDNKIKVKENEKN